MLSRKHSRHARLTSKEEVAHMIPYVEGGFEPEIVEKSCVQGLILCWNDASTDTDLFVLSRARGHQAAVSMLESVCGCFLEDRTISTHWKHSQSTTFVAHVIKKKIGLKEFIRTVAKRLRTAQVDVRLHQLSDPSVSSLLDGGSLRRSLITSGLWPDDLRMTFVAHDTLHETVVAST